MSLKASERFFSLNHRGRVDQEGFADETDETGGRQEDSTSTVWRRARPSFWRAWKA